MNFAIISAGEGSRLAQEGVQKPKPLVELNGEAMIERLVRIFVRQGAERVVVIVNDRVPETKEFLLRLKEELPIELVVKNTPSSMHSFHEISHLLGDGKFALPLLIPFFAKKNFLAISKPFVPQRSMG